MAKYAKRGRPSKADVAARKKAERQEIYKMSFALFAFVVIIGMIIYSASV
jgi:23S rRNA maturation mini-RNase III